MAAYLSIVQIELAQLPAGSKTERIATMSLVAVAKFERAIDYVAPAAFLILGMVAAFATAMVGV